jgi:hypothetical protein
VNVCSAERGPGRRRERRQDRGVQGTPVHRHWTPVFSVTATAYDSESCQDSNHGLGGSSEDAEPVVNRKRRSDVRKGWTFRAFD